MSDKLYIRTFGTKNFDVTISGHGIRKTSQPVDGYTYEFYINEENVVRIREYDEHNDYLELTDIVRNPELQCLPTLIRESYSFWYSPTYSMFILRPYCFQDRKIFYLLSIQNDYNLFKIPIQYRHDTSNIAAINNILIYIINNYENVDRLLLNKSNLLNIVAKFESPEFIHIFIGATSTYNESFEVIKILLPRYEMEFELRSDGR